MESHVGSFAVKLPSLKSHLLKGKFMGTRYMDKLYHVLMGGDFGKGEALRLKQENML